MQSDALDNIAMEAAPLVLTHASWGRVRLAMMIIEGARMTYLNFGAVVTH